MDLCHKDWCPAFPPPQKLTLAVIPDNLNSNFKEVYSIANDSSIEHFNSGDQSQQVIYHYMPIHTSEAQSLDSSQAFNKGIQNSNNCKQTPNVDMASGQVSGGNSMQNSFFNSFIEGENSLSANIDKFLRDTKQKFNEKVLQHYESCKQSDADGSLPHRRKSSFCSNEGSMLENKNNDRGIVPRSRKYRGTNHSNRVITAKNKKYVNDKPKYRNRGAKNNYSNRPKYNNKYKIDRRFNEEKPLSNLIDESFDSILAKAVNDVESRRKLSEHSDSRLPTKFSKDENRQFNEVDNSNTPYNDTCKTTISAENINMNEASQNVNVNFDNIYAVMQSDLAQEIIQYFTEEKVTDLAKYVLQKKNTYVQENNTQQSNISNIPSYNYPIDEQNTYERKSSADRSHYSGLYDDSCLSGDDFTESSYSGNSLQNKQYESDNVSAYSTDMDVSPASCKEQENKDEPTTKTDDSKNVENKLKSDIGNIHYYSSPDENTDYTPPNRDRFRSPFYSKDINHNLSDRNSFALSPKHRRYSMSSRNDIAYSKYETSQVRNLRHSPKYRRSPIRRHSYNNDKISSKYKSKYSTSRYISSIKNPRLSRKQAGVKSPFKNSSEHSHCKRLEISLRNKSQLPHKRDRDISPNKKGYKTYEGHLNSKKYNTFQNKSTSFPPKYEKEFSPVKNRAQYSNHERSRSSPIKHSRSRSSPIKHSRCYSPRNKRYYNSHRGSMKYRDSYRVSKDYSPRRSIQESSKDNVKSKRPVSDFDKRKNIKLITTQVIDEHVNESMPVTTKIIDKQRNESMTVMPTVIEKYVMESNPSITKVIDKKMKASERSKEENKYTIMPKIDELLENQEYEAFADQFLLESLSDVQSSNKTSRTQASVHKRLGPLQCRSPLSKYSNQIPKGKNLPYDESSLLDEGLFKDHEKGTTEYSNGSGSFLNKSDFNLITRTITNMNKRECSPISSTRKGILGDSPDDRQLYHTTHTKFINKGRYRGSLTKSRKYR